MENIKKIKDIANELVRNMLSGNKNATYTKFMKFKDNAEYAIEIQSKKYSGGFWLRCDYVRIVTKEDYYKKVINIEEIPFDFYRALPLPLKEQVKKELNIEKVWHNITLLKNDCISSECLEQEVVKYINEYYFNFCKNHKPKLDEIKHKAKKDAEKDKKLGKTVNYDVKYLFDKTDYNTRLHKLFYTQYSLTL